MYTSLSKRTIIHSLEFVDCINDNEWFVRNLRSKIIGYWKFNSFLFPKLIPRFAVLDELREEYFPLTEFIKITTYQGISLVQKRS